LVVLLSEAFQGEARPNNTAYWKSRFIPAQLHPAVTSRNVRAISTHKNNYIPVTTAIESCAERTSKKIARVVE